MKGWIEVHFLIFWLLFGKDLGELGRPLWDKQKWNVQKFANFGGRSIFDSMNFKLASILVRIFSFIFNFFECKNTSVKYIDP